MKLSTRLVSYALAVFAFGAAPEATMAKTPTIAELEALRRECLKDSKLFDEKTFVAMQECSKSLAEEAAKRPPMIMNAHGAVQHERDFAECVGGKGHPLSDAQQKTLYTCARRRPEPAK